MSEARPAPYPADTRAKGWRYSVGAFLDAARVAPEKAVFRPALPMFLLPGWNGTNMGKMTYGEQLKHPNWQRKRLEVLQAAEFRCQACYDGESTLHVHHKHYVKGRMAWEYDAKELAALCESCHEEEHAQAALRSNILARLDVDGPCSVRDFFSNAAGHLVRWAHDPELIAAMEMVCSDAPHQFNCGRVGSGIGNLRINAIALGDLANLLDGPDTETRERFVSGFLRLIEEAGINPHPVPFKAEAKSA